MLKVAFRNRAPADADVLGGSHERLANAIVSLIRESTRGMSVAVMGGWGSGKSTIVNLIARKLTDPKSDPVVQSRVFIFDAWAHQGDPLRRSFLQCFFEFMTAAENWVQKGAPWDGDPKHTVEQHIKRTTGQSETVITRTDKSLSPWGIAVTVAALLAAGATAILPKLDTAKPDTLKFFWLQLVALLLPFLVALLARVSGKHDRTLYQLLVRDAEEEKTVETSRTLDPTAVDFQRVFVNLCNRALNTNRRLLIVIDNLDRIEAAEALNMWATMRTFFEYDEGGRPSPGEDNWRNRLWLIIPLDRSALQRLWKDDGSGSLINSFIQKTFDIVYDVPTPVLTKRKEFFQSELKAAIDDSTQEYEVVYFLADRYREQISTPREIKLFINHRAGLYLQWKGKIDLPLLALYILQTASPKPLESAPAEPAEAAAAVSPTARPASPAPPEFDFRVPPAILDLLTKPAWRENWEAAMGAIHFNVALEDAGEVVDGPRILDALERNPTKLPELVQRKWFWEVCHRVVQDRYTEWVAGPDLLASAILALQNCPPPSNPDDARTAATVWNALKSIALRSPHWKLSERVTEAVLNLADRPEALAEKGQLKEKLLAAGKRVPPPIPETALMTALRGETTEAEPLTDWARGIVRLIIRGHFGDPIDLTQQWPSAMLLIASNWKGSDIPIERFTTRDPKGAISGLASIGFQNEIGPQYWALLQSMKATGVWPWAQIRNVVMPWNSGNATWEIAARAIRILLFADPDAAQTAYVPYGKLVQAGASLVELVDAAIAALNWPDAARLLFVLYSQSKSISIHPKFPSPNPPELVSAITDLFSAIARLDVVLAWMEVPAGTNLCRDVIAAGVAAGKGGQLAPVGDNLFEYQKLSSILPPDVAASLAGQLAGSDAFITKTLTQITAVNLAMFAETMSAAESILAVPNFPQRPQFLQGVLKEAAQMDFSKLPSDTSVPVLKQLFDSAGCGWLPLHSAVSALKYVQETHSTLAPASPAYLQTCFQRRIDMGSSTVDDLLTRAAQSDGILAPALYDLAIERAQSDAALDAASSARQLVWGRALVQKAGRHFGKTRQDLYATAEAHFSRAVQLDAQNIEARRSEIDALLVRLEDVPPVTARPLLSAAVASTNDPLSRGRVHLALAKLDESASSLPDCVQAIADFRAILQNDPGNGEAHRLLAEAIAEQGRRSLAAEADALYDSAENQLGLIATPTSETLLTEGRVLLSRARAGAA